MPQALPLDRTLWDTKETFADISMILYCSWQKKILSQDEWDCCVWDYVAIDLHGLDVCFDELCSPWFRAKQSLCSIVYFQLSLHIRVKELIVLMSATGNIDPSHGNPKIYPQVSMQPPSTNLLKMWRIVIGGWTSRSRVRSCSRHCSAMKTNTLESKRQRDALEKKIQCVDDSASVASSNIQLYMQPNKKKGMYMFSIPVLLCAMMSQSWKKNALNVRSWLRATCHWTMTSVSQ